MVGLGAALLGGAAIGGLGNYLGAREDRKAQESANATNLQSAREQMQFQREMSNTSYQRAMTDMREAGLNPMLAFSQGGASSPSGAMAHVDPASKGYGRAVAKTVGESVSTASQINQMQNTTAQTQSNVGLQGSQQEVNKAQATATKMNTLKSKAETMKTLQDTKQSSETFQDRKNILRLQRQMDEVDADWQKTEKGIHAAKGASEVLGNLLSPLFKGPLGGSQQGNSGKNPPPTRQRNYVQPNDNW